jgi:hypothetical protein
VGDEASQRDKLLDYVINECPKSEGASPRPTGNFSLFYRKIYEETPDEKK